MSVTVTVTNDMSDDETTPTPDTFDPLSYDGYDADENGSIDRPEVINRRSDDYFDDMITREQVL